MSSAYVSGILESEHIEIISHLQPTDYIAITPQWLVPAAPTLLSVFLFLIALFSLFLRNPPDGILHKFIRIRGWPFWVLTGASTVYLVTVAPRANDPGFLPQGLFPPEVRRGLILAIVPVLICFVYIGFCAPLFSRFLDALPALIRNRREILSKPARGAMGALWPDLVVTKNRLRLMWASVILGLLLFVHYIGHSYAPVVLKGNPAVDVIVQTTASTTKQFRGKILFVVSHPTLLLEDRDEHASDKKGGRISSNFQKNEREYHQHVIIVPNDKIVSLETVSENPLPNETSKPILKSASLPNPSAMSSPTPASTPAPAPSTSANTPAPTTMFVPTPSPGK